MSQGLARLALFGASWLVGVTQPQGDTVVQVVASAERPQSSAPAPVARDARSPAAIATEWRAAALRTLASDHHSFGVAVRRLEPDPSGDCGARELVIVNGYDHVPQYLARVALRAAGGRCVPETSPRRWSPRALHFSDVAVADFDRDGRDELVVSAFADSSGRMHTGSVRVVAGGDPWRFDPPPLSLARDEGFAPSSVAIGDVDGDGRLDLVVASFWRGALGAGRDVKHIRGGELDGPTLLFRGVDPGSAPFAFAPPDELAARGVVELRLVDVDLDGALDVVSAGAEVSVSFGPDFGDTHVLPLGDEAADVVALSIDVAWTPDRAHALVAFTQSCLSADECATAGDGVGVAVWAIATQATRDERLVGFWPTPGIPSPLRFVALGDVADRAREALPDLLVGLMSLPGALPSAPLVGRPWLGRLGLVGASPLLLPGASLLGAHARRAAWQALALRAPSPSFPMASAIVAYADARDAHVIEEAPRPARAILTYTGPGEVVAAEVRGASGQAAGRPFGSSDAVVPSQLVPGDAHVSIAPRPGREVVVTWHVVARPHLIVTSACPLAGPAAGTLFIKPPERVRGSHTALLAE